MSAIKGYTYGGPTPITGATVQLWTTGISAGTSSNYGVGVSRATTTSSLVDGSFTFTSSYTCPAHQFAYLTAAGGNSGSATQDSGSGATAAVSSLDVTSAPVTSGGSGYTTPVVTFSAPPSGTTATGTVTASGGVVTKVTITAQGSGYTSIPTATITDSTGPGSGATVSVASGVLGISVTAGGSSYNNAPPVTVSAPPSGTTTAAYATLSSGAVSGITVTGPGQGYTTVPTVTLGTPTGNSAVLLVAALGRCEDLYDNGSGGTFSSTGGYTGNFIYVSELTTVAAAYALGGFSTVTGNGSTAALGIGSTPTNNSLYTPGTYSYANSSNSPASVGCIAGHPAGCTTTAAAGLFHAFLNAATLVNPFAPLNAGTTSANQTLSTNSAAVMPYLLLNTIANAMVACVNSVGASSPGCTVFLGAGGPSGTPATNTFSAVKFMASNPELTGAGSTVSQLLANCGSGANCIYSPALNGGTIPSTIDLSVAIVYPSGSFSGTGIQGLTNIAGAALDINDNLYIGNANAAIATSTIGNMFSLRSDGMLLSSTANATTDTALERPAELESDPNGNIFQLPYGNTTVPLVYWTNSNGNFGTSTDLANGTSKATAAFRVDKFGDAFYTTLTSGTAKVYEYSALPTTSTTPTQIGPTAGFTANSGNTMGIDPDQNIYVSSSGGAGNTIIANTGGVTTATPPAYGTGTPVTGTGQNTSAWTYTSATSGYVGVGIANQSTMVNSTSTVNNGPYKATLTLSGDAVTAEAKGAIGGNLYDSSKGPGLGLATADGVQTVFSAAQTSGHYGVTYNPQGTGNVYVYQYTAGSVNTAYLGGLIEPCETTVATGPTYSCTNPFGAAPVHALIDATGTLWTDSGTGGNIIQIIGTAAPVWPLNATGNVGKP